MQPVLLRNPILYLIIVTLVMKTTFFTTIDAIAAHLVAHLTNAVVALIALRVLIVLLFWSLLSLLV